MREQTEREPFHCERIIMEFQRKAHITDVAFEAVTIAHRTLCDVTLRLDGWEFTVTPHMDVPEVVEAYHKQPGWFVETMPGRPTYHILTKNPLDPDTALPVPDGPRVTQSQAMEVQNVEPK